MIAINKTMGLKVETQKPSCLKKSLKLGKPKNEIKDLLKKSKKNFIIVCYCKKKKKREEVKKKINHASSIYADMTL